MTVTIVVSIPPASLLTSNQRLHWAERATRVKVCRALAFRAWVDAGQPRFDRAHIVVSVAYPDRRQRDVHNLMGTVKALVDGLVSGMAGRGGHLLPDDSDKHLTGPDLRHDGVDPDGKWRFTLTIEGA